MRPETEDTYDYIRGGGSGFHKQKRGLIAVWGKEAVQFLDGLISNDVKTLADGAQMLAAFPNAQGRLLVVVRVLRQGDRFLFETEEATREKVFNNLVRFTFAGDFFVEDLSDSYEYFELFGSVGDEFPQDDGVITLKSDFSLDCFVRPVDADAIGGYLTKSGVVEISDELYELLRIENGVPKYGVDMDETTIVPELGIDGLISYNKGCYIGQEIIARIHFRGHVAKQLTGLILSAPPAVAVSEPGAVATGFLPGGEIKTAEGKNAGRITSVAFSPKLGRTIALAYVRYDYLAEDTKLGVSEFDVVVKTLPFL
jgi:folate-binding protein YgfZ